jgi:ornithine decarboxylase
VSITRQGQPAYGPLEAPVRAGSRFDVASPGEVQACLRAGAAATDLLYSNPVKRTSDIAAARALGVRRFVADRAGEVAKVAAAVRNQRY